MAGKRGKQNLVVEKNIGISEMRQVQSKMIAAQLSTIENRLIETVSRPKLEMGGAKKTNYGH